MTGFSELQNTFLSAIQKPCNKSCADCKLADVSFASVTFGVFLCSRCAVIHQTFGGDVRSISSEKTIQGFWNDDTIQRTLSHGGNDTVNSRLEAEFPQYYRRPWPSENCPNFLFEAFNKSKYLYEEFSKGAVERNAQCNFACSSKSGIILKKLRDSETFVDRFFELSVERNTLRYFIKPGDSEPKETLDLEKMNITFLDSIKYNVPPHTALLQFVQDGSTRHIFVRSEDSRSIINWYNAIRLGKYHRMCINLTCLGFAYSTLEIASQLTRDVDISGWLSKTGPRKSDAWRRRWCMLLKRHLLYMDKPLSAFAKGELFIGSKEDGFSVIEGTPDNWKKHSGFAFTIRTSSRPFVFFSETEKDRENWMTALEECMQTSLTLEESKRAASIAQKHGSYT